MKALSTVEYPSLGPLVLVLVSVFMVIFLVLKYLTRPILIKKDFTRDEASSDQMNLLYKSYPNGWIGVCDSIDLNERDIKRADFCGHSVILVRSSATGKPHAFDAFCPHIGADLSMSSKKVTFCETECVRCPFHGWSFRVDDGLCVDVPYTKNREPPKGVKMKSWNCFEANGVVHVWHHDQGLEPTWYPSVITEIESRKFILSGRTEHLVNCPIQEIPENGADFAHLNELHGPSFLWANTIRTDGNLFRDFIQMRWETSWRKGDSDEESHLAFIKLKGIFNLFNCPTSEFTFDIVQTGPCLVNLPFEGRSPFFSARGAVIQYIVPLGLNKQKLVHHAYIEPNWSSLIIGRFVIMNEIHQVERDIQIWTRKKYLRNPVLVADERSIRSFRRWYSQFFTLSNQPSADTDYQDQSINNNHHHQNKDKLW